MHTLQAPRLIWIFIFLFLTFHLPVQAATKARPLPQNFPTEIFWYDGKWAHEKSNLAPRADITFARLKNGLRYAIIPNATPPGRVSLYLDVQVGSLMEREDQLGYAHFLEHMVFNGSRNYPAGSLIPFFQKNGMSFGGDTNAHTSYAETVYKLNLAGTDTETIRKGLNVLRDFADGATISQKEVDDEKGVILAEKSARDSEMFQARKKRMSSVYAGTAFVNDIIGTEACIRNATSASITEFYKTWYHADRMVLIIVGDVKAENIVPLVHENFSSLAATHSPQVPSWGDTQKNGVHAHQRKRPVSGMELYLFFTHNRTHQADSRQTQLESFLDLAAQYCLQQRLIQRQQKESNLWSMARFINRWREGLLPMTAIISKYAPENWQHVVEVLAEEINSACTFGFDKQEIEQAVRYLSSMAMKRDKMNGAMLNRQVADEFVYYLNNDRVYTDTGFNLKLLKELSPKITPKAVKQALVQALDVRHMNISVEGDNPPEKEHILKQWQQVISRPVKAHLTASVQDFPYLPLAKQPQIKSLAPLALKKLGPQKSDAPVLHYATLQNSIPVYLMPTMLEKEEMAAVHVLFGKKMKDSTPKEVLLSKAATRTLAEGGLGKLSRTDSQRFFIDLGGRVSESYDSFGGVIAGTAFSSQLTNLVLAAWTQYKDPTVDQNMLSRVQINLDLQKKERFDTVDGVDRAETQYFLHGSSPRFAPLEAEEAKTIQLGEIKDFLQKTRSENPSAILVSGNFDLNEAYTQLARTFGTLPAVSGSASQAPLKNKLQFPAGKSLKKTIADSVDKARLVFASFCPLPDIHDRHLWLTRQVATAILGDYCRQELRERMGAAYSPRVYYNMPLAENGYGFLAFNIATESTHLSEIKTFINNIQPWEITAEEIKKAVLPLQTSWKSARNTNRFWQRTMLTELQSGLPVVKWNNETVDDLDSITPKEVSIELKKMLSGKKAFVEIKSSHVPEK